MCYWHPPQFSYCCLLLVRSTVFLSLVWSLSIQGKPWQRAVTTSMARVKGHGIQIKIKTSCRKMLHGCHRDLLVGFVTAWTHNSSGVNNTLLQWQHVLSVFNASTTLQHLWPMHPPPCNICDQFIHHPATSVTNSSATLHCLWPIHLLPCNICDQFIQYPALSVTNSSNTLLCQWPIHPLPCTICDQFIHYPALSVTNVSTTLHYLHSLWPIYPLPCTICTICDQFTHYPALSVTSSSTTLHYPWPIHLLLCTVCQLSFWGNCNAHFWDTSWLGV